MLTKTIGLSFGWAGVLFGSALAFAPGCGGTGDTGGGACTPNQQVSCDCKDGSRSVQVCSPDGKSFEECQCGAGGSTGGSGGSTGGAGGTGTTQSGLCGNGIQDPGECDPGEFACPQDCTGTGGAGGGTTTSSNTCEGVVTYAGLIPNVASAWGAHPQANGQTGYDAGIEICKTIGADHPCTYEEMRKAEMANELANIAQGTTTWIHRTTPEMVNNVMSQPGAGGRCNNWIYTTNHISDGEFSTFDQVGVPTYHLDNDTFFNGVDTTHTITGDLQCGGEMRAILCCYPACVP